jgi:hypothetical protein
MMEPHRPWHPQVTAPGTHKGPPRPPIRPVPLHFAWPPLPLCVHHAAVWWWGGLPKWCVPIHQVHRTAPGTRKGPSTPNPTPCHYISPGLRPAQVSTALLFGGGAVSRNVVARGGWVDVGGPCGCQAPAPPGSLVSTTAASSTTASAATTGTAGAAGSSRSDDDRFTVLKAGQYFVICSIG